MNPNTRLVICCYGGDAHQVIKALGAYLHHRCPIVVLSPTDCPADVRYPGIESRFAGKRAYIGPESLDRQRRYLQMLLTFPEEYFLVHDADSVCLSPELPAYLYQEPDILWSNLVIDPIPEHQPAYPEGFPHIAFQPPYFLSRKTVEGLLSGGSENIVANPTMPFVDHYMVQIALWSKWPYRGFPDGISCPFSSHAPSRQLVFEAVRDRGVIFIHSVKDKPGMDRLFRERQEYLRTHGG